MKRLIWWSLLWYDVDVWCRVICLSSFAFWLQPQLFLALAPTHSLDLLGHIWCYVKSILQIESLRTHRTSTKSHRSTHTDSHTTQPNRPILVPVFIIYKSSFFLSRCSNEMSYALCRRRSRCRLLLLLLLLPLYSASAWCWLRKLWFSLFEPTTQRTHHTG